MKVLLFDDIDLTGDIRFLKKDICRYAILGDISGQVTVTAPNDSNSQTLLTNHRHPVVDALLDAYDDFKNKTNGNS